MTIIVDYVAVAILLFCAVWQDIQKNKISNRLNVAGAIVGGVLALILPHRDVLDALFGVLVCFLCGLLCWNLKVFRAGDAKLFCAIGAFMGWQLGLSCILYAIIIGGLIGLPRVVWHRIIKKEKEMVKMVFSVSIAIGCILCYVCGAIWDVIPIPCW